MNRKGQNTAFTIVIGVLLFLLIFFVSVAFFTKTSYKFSATFSCPTDTPGYVCRSATEAAGESHGTYQTLLGAGNCLAGEKSVFSVFHTDNGGCAPIETCCFKKDIDDPNDDVATPQDAPTLTLNLYRLTTDAPLAPGYKNVKIVEKEPITGNAVDVITEEFIPFMLVAEVTNCKECDLDNSEILITLTEPSGTDVLHDIGYRVEVSDRDPTTITKVESTRVPKYPEFHDDRYTYFDTSRFTRNAGDREDFSMDRSMLLRFPADFDQETLTLEAEATLAFKSNPTTGTGREFTKKISTQVYFNVLSAIRYGIPGYNQWSQEKRVTALCEKGIKCTETGSVNNYIFYEIIPSDANNVPAFSCVLPTDAQLDAATLLSDRTDYCIRDAQDPRKVGACYEGKSACETALAQLEDPVYSEALQQFLDAIGTSEITDRATEFASLFQQHESRISYLSCQPDRLKEQGMTSSRRRVLFAAETNERSVQRASFDLNLPFMSEQHLCVYGRDVYGNVYVADRNPRFIKIDRTPPFAHVDFNPITLMLSFQCFDAASGCTEEYSTAYVDKISNFLPALFSNRPQNAIVWCPEYEHGYGYRNQPAARVPYHDNAIRVLCLRVEDRAGNVGITMRTVYNTWTLLAVAYAKYKDKQLGLEYDEKYNQDYDDSYYYG